MKQMVERNAWLLMPGTILGIGFGLFLNGYWLIDKFPAESRQLLFFTVLAGLARYSRIFPVVRMDEEPLASASIVAEIRS